MTALPEKIQLKDISACRDEIYGICIIWIMLFHGHVLCDVTYAEGIPVLERVLSYLNYGNMGVDVFMLLSGICLYFSMTRDSDAWHFMKKRLRRIVPAYYMICAPVLLPLVLCHILELRVYLAKMTIMRMLFHEDQGTWFVTTILIFYLLYPYIYGYIHQKEEGSAGRTLFLITISVLAACIMRIDSPEYYDYVEIGLTRLPVFILGAYMGRQVYEKKEISPWWYLLFAVCILTVFGLLDRKLVHDIYQRYLYGAAGISMTFLFTFIVKHLHEGIRKLLRFFGGISLELYLSHISLKQLYVNHLLFPYHPGSAGGWLAMLGLSIILAWSVSLIIDKGRQLL